MKAVTFIMAGVVGMIFLAAVFMLPERLQDVSAKGEATILARNIDDAARRVAATPKDSVASVTFSLPDNLADQRYELVFWSGKVWMGTEDGRLWNYSTIVSDPTFHVYQGGDNMTLAKNATGGVVAN